MNFEPFYHILKESQIRLNEPMSRHTTFGIGGPADIFLMPSSVEELQQVCRLVREMALPFFIVGGGANLLVRDKGIRGAVIFTGRMQSLQAEGCHLRAASGVSTARAARLAMESGLSGMEFAAGIPGTIGGAAFMNAGAYGGEMGKIVSAVTTCDSEGSMHRYSREELTYRYRHSRFMDSPEIITEVELLLTPGDPDQILEKMNDYNGRRHEKQPLESRSAGSTFKRPEGHFVGAMLEEAGLKGYAVGDAEVSRKHAGFLINRGRATCADMLALISDIQEKVKERYGVTLEPEVQIVGEK